MIATLMFQWHEPLKNYQQVFDVVILVICQYQLSGKEKKKKKEKDKRGMEMYKGQA